MDDATSSMKQCPYCAEMIRQEAIKCRYCGSNLTERRFSFDFLSAPGYWHRVQEGKKIAGVCTGIARQIDAPVLLLPLRLFFILTTLFYGFGALVYIVLWVLMPGPTDGTPNRTSNSTSHGAPSAMNRDTAAATPAAPPPDPAPEDTGSAQRTMVIAGMLAVALGLLFIGPLRRLASFFALPGGLFSAPALLMAAVMVLPIMLAVAGWNTAARTQRTA